MFSPSAKEKIQVEKLADNFSAALNNFQKVQRVSFINIVILVASCREKLKLPFGQ